MNQQNQEPEAEVGTGSSSVVELFIRVVGGAWCNGTEFN